MSIEKRAVLTSEEKLIDYYNRGIVEVETINDGFRFICGNGFRFKATGDNKYNFEKILKVVETLGKKS